MQDFWIQLHAILADCCAKFDETWQQRKRAITTEILVVFILKLVLSKNNQGYQILLNELWESSELACIQEKPFAASSICEARQKMPEVIFTDLNRAVLLAREKQEPLPLWQGHRVFGVDGSKINLPHELLAAGYMAPNKGQYYPQGIMSALYHLGSGYIYDITLNAERSERHILLAHMETMQPGDVLVLDRGYFSYLILVKAMEKGIHLICRMQSGTVNTAVKRFWESDSQDEIITYKPSVAVKYESRKQGYELDIKPVRLRLIKYTIGDETYVCSTTLLDQKKYPLDEFPSVYHGRWGIEELYKISKVFIDIEEFHSKSELGVKQECYAHALIINFARIFESEANNQLPPPSPKGKNKPEKQDGYWQDFVGEIKNIKTNFKNTLLVIGRSLEKLLLPENDSGFLCIPLMLGSIARVRQKIRRGRHSPRQSRKPVTKWLNISGGSAKYA